MARINVEEKFWTDPRFIQLSENLGDHLKAIGMCVYAWKLAQTYWQEHETGIPKELFPSKLEALASVCLVVLRSNHYYVCGSQDSFEWLQKKKMAGKAGGSQSAKMRKKRTGSAQPLGTSPEASSKHFQANASTSNPLPLSLPLSLSLSNLKDQEISARPGAPKKGDQDTKDLISHYCSIYKSRYGNSPPVTGKALGIAKMAIKDLGLEKAKLFIEAYLSMNDSWFLTKHHDLGTFAASLTKIATFAEKGVFFSKNMANTMEKKAQEEMRVIARPQEQRQIEE